MSQNKNTKWITIHPNGKGEKPGVHVAINGEGKIVKGPDGLKDEINAEGGLPGAKSVPLEELKAKGDAQNGQGEKPDFEPPDDDMFSSLLDEHEDSDKTDGASDFTPPDDDEFAGILEDDDDDDNDDDAGEPGEDPAKKIANLLSDAFGLESPSKFPVEKLEKYAQIQAQGNPEKEKLWLEWVKSHQNLLVDNGFGGVSVVDNQAYEAAQNDIENAVGGAAQTSSGEGGDLTEAQEKWLDKWKDQYAKSVAASYGVDATSAEKIVEAVITEHPEAVELSKISGSPIFKLTKDGDGFNEAIAAKVYELKAGNATSSDEPQKFTDEQIEKFVAIAKSPGSQYHYDEEHADALKEIIKEYPEFFKYDDDGDFVPGILPSDLNDLVNSKVKEMQKAGSAPTTTATTGNENPPATPPPPAQPVSAALTEGNVPFPKDVAALGSLTMVKQLGGGSGANATLYKDADGNMFVMKRFEASNKVGQQRIKEECDADAYYLAGGANVPHFKLYGDEKTGYTKLSEYIPNTKTLGEVWGSSDKAMRAKIREGLKKNFALDVMAGAWDVLGTGHDNILVDKDGNVYRCDNGGAFNRRAKGDEKSEETWGNGHLDDLWTMRGMSAGLDGKTVPDDTGKKDFFGDITTHQLLSDIASRDWDKMIAHLPDATRKVMEKRIANAKEYHAVCDNVVTAGMYGDGQHSEDITLNYHCLNKFGAKAGCTNQNISPGNWGFCRGKGNGKPAPTLSQFLTDKQPQLTDFTNAPEPQLTDFMPDKDANEAANVLKTAGISLNKHLFVDKDGKPNMTSVDAALALKPKLEAVAKGTDANAKKAQKMLDYVNQIEQMKAGGFKNLATEMPHSPGGAVDLNTPEAKAAAEAAFKTAHADWENKTAHAQKEFKKAEAAYAVKKAAAQKKLAAATKKWQAANGDKAFKWDNLTDCYEDFCKQNGIDSSLFWQMAKGQGSKSESKESCQMKAIELHAMGFSWHDIATDHCKGVALAHLPKTSNVAKEFETNPQMFESYRKAYTAMKSLTSMILRNSSFNTKLDDNNIIVVRTEDEDDVVKKYGVKNGVACIYPIGTHESFGTFHKVTVLGSSSCSIAFKIPFSRISSVYWLENPSGSPMYWGDGENEIGCNAALLPGVLVSNGPSEVIDYKQKLLSALKGKITNLT